MPPVCVKPVNSASPSECSCWASTRDRVTDLMPSQPSRKDPSTVRPSDEVAITEVVVSSREVSFQFSRKGIPAATRASFRARFRRVRFTPQAGWVYFEFHSDGSRDDPKSSPVNFLSMSSIRFGAALVAVSSKPRIESTLSLEIYEQFLYK